jgi:hypothetical protein
MLWELIDCMCIEPIGSSPCNRNRDYRSVRGIPACSENAHRGSHQQKSKERTESAPDADSTEPDQR